MKILIFSLLFLSFNLFSQKPDIFKIDSIPAQGILLFGRVLLNLINNAIYAVSIAPQPPKGEKKQPLVAVSTKLISVANSPSQQERGLGGEVQIKISDNGSGMSSETITKIFQPFFTTKPTGQGTGLGLSLAYDIITKGHGGTIEVESVKGEGTEFIVKLPVV
jgi:signal transduction histidine kinase